MDHLLLYLLVFKCRVLRLTCSDRAY
uniref:Uncharacterized protein n=1 Tax=Arundo donax TaxID=35708 RepID=A0A0A8YVQ3_ARUDO